MSSLTLIYSEKLKGEVVGDIDLGKSETFYNEKSTTIFTNVARSDWVGFLQVNFITRLVRHQAGWAGDVPSMVQTVQGLAANDALHDDLFERRAA